MRHKETGASAEMRNGINKYWTILKHKGAFDIIISTFIVKILMFASAMFLPKFMDVTAYGSLTMAETYLSYFLIINGLGLTASTMKYCTSAETVEEKKGILFYTTVIGSAFNCILLVFIIISSKVLVSEVGNARILFCFMAGIPLLSHFFHNLQLFLRTEFKNKKYAISTIIYSLLYLILQIVLAKKHGARGVIIARYITYIICCVIVLAMIKDLFGIKADKVNTETGKKIIKFSIVALCANFFSSLLLNNEIMLLSCFTTDSKTIASFKVATYFLQICYFIVDAFLVFLTPYFVKNANDANWIWNTYKKMSFMNCIIMISVIFFLFFIKKTLVLIVWGEKYLLCLPIINIVLVIAAFQTILRMMPGNLLPYIGGITYNLKLNTIMSIVHVIVGYSLYKICGIKAVGISLALVYLVSGLLMQFKVYFLTNKSKLPV